MSTPPPAKDPGASASSSVQGGGLIGLFARHPTASNLTMVLMVVLGLAALSRINTQFFPDFGIDVIAIQVSWPGATGEDVDANIVQALEPELRFLDNVKQVTATAYDGLASINVEYEPGADMQSALSEVESAVAQVTTLPEDAEAPEVRRVTRYDTINRLVLSGPLPESSLKALAKRIRDDLLERGIDKVDIFGGRSEEILVEVPPETLRRLDLTIGEIGTRIAATSQDVPSGDLAGGERQVRSLGLLTDARSLRTVEIKALEDGRKILLRDIARVEEAFEDGGQTARRNGNPAFELHVQRALNADALALARITDAYLEEIKPTLPPTVTLEKYDVISSLIEDRIRVLIENGLSGLLLVLLVLFLFLHARVAFWVALGIPISLLATIAVMLATGQTINMISLFGMIMAIGIVVDDAIVVGEHAAFQNARGISPHEASIIGARRMAVPVTSATLTTVASFLPLFMIGDIMGEIIAGIPLVIIAMLLASLLECFLVLPGHLRSAFHPMHWGLLKPYYAFRNGFDRGYAAFRDGPFRRLVRVCVHWRYATLAMAIMALLLTVGLVAGGRVGFQFFPTPESDKIYANVEMSSGTSRAETAAALDRIEAALYQTAQALGDPEGDLVHLAIQKLGTSVAGGNAAVGGGGNATDTLGGLVVELKPSDQRAVRTSDFVAAWRDHVPPIPGLETLTIRAFRGGPPGRDVDVRLLAPDRTTDIADLKQAAEEVRQLLQRFEGVSDIEDDLPYGAPETILQVTPRGRALDFTTESVGRQVRNAIEGSIAKRFARGDEEVTVRVRYPQDDLESLSLDALYLRSPAGKEVALSEIVSFTEDIGFAAIRREDGKRQVAITAEIDTALNSVGKVQAALEEEGHLQAIAERYDLEWSLAGRAEERREAMKDMMLGTQLALIAIYIVLAWVFASYWRPLVVMMVIPFGFIGAVLGHWLLGYDLTMLSMVALLGLSGIVINDSIVLVTTIDEKRREESTLEAIIDGSCDRLRAVLLTSATTIGGLIPLMFETSLQAQFLIPMALTIVFGLGVATVLILLVVPALVGIQGDIAQGLKWLRRWLIPEKPMAAQETPPNAAAHP